MTEEKLQTNLEEFSRCEEQTWAQLDDEGSHHRIDNKDVALEDTIRHALWLDTVLRVTDLDDIEIHVRDGIAHLSGYLTSVTNRKRVDKALETVEGLRNVRSELVVDDQLTYEVSASLAELEHQYQCKFFTGVSHGVVALNGEVNSLEVREAAEKLAASNPQVRGVLNYISVPGLDQNPEEHRFLQPSIGGDINFRDGAAGTVEQVVINPDNRLVVAAVIKGHIVDALQPVIVQSDSQLLVIPMSAMGNLTNNSGSLTIKSTDSTAYQEFNADNFITPWADWAPPYPYCSKDVLFPAEYHQPGKIEGKPDQAPSMRKDGEKALNEEIDHNDSLGG
jgi:osmotically-inducible protein OsmY